MVPQKRSLYSLWCIRVYGNGAVLAHRESNGEGLVITQTAAEKLFSDTERSLGMYSWVSHICQYGHRFTLVTDHKLLLSLFKEHKAIPQLASGRIQKWGLAYEYATVFLPTATHTNADALSYLPIQCQEEQVPETTLVKQIDDNLFTAQQVKYFTARDPYLLKVLTYVQKGWSDRVQERQLRPYWHCLTELMSHDGWLCWGQCVLIPSQGRKQHYRSYIVDTVASPGWKV